MGIKLYVGGLPYTTTEDELKAYFAEYGEITSVFIVMDRESGKSKGFGFVEFDEKEAGENAIKELNGKDFGGRSLTVNEARPKN